MIALLFIMGVSVTVRVQVTFVEPSSMILHMTAQESTFPVNCYLQDNEVLCR